MTPLGPELERALLRELSRAWSGLNALHFHHALKPPVLALSEGDSKLGSWIPGTRSMVLARSLVLEQPWGVVIEVLKHEMAHQYAHEELGARDETAHGPAFRTVCDRLGIDAASGGLPRAPGDAPEDRVVRRITKLLALAESPNQNEASAAMNAARRLMLEHNLAATSERTYGFRQLGPPEARITEGERLLAGILTQHFFVQGIWVPVYEPLTGRTGKVLEICGSNENLDMASYVHGFLRETAWRLWRAHRRVAGVSGERERQRYTAGVMLGFLDQLAAGAVKNREEGLVWVGDPRLEGYLHTRHPRTRTVRHSGGAWTPSFEEGRSAGRNIVLHRPISSQGQGAPKLLGGS